MATMSAIEAKTRFAEILQRVARGEEVVITCHDQPVARVIPENSRNLQSVRNAVLNLRKLREDISEYNQGKPKLTEAEVRSWVAEGRR